MKMQYIDIERQFEKIDGNMNIADVTSFYLNIDPNVNYVILYYAHDSND